MYICKECKAEYKEKVEYCDCGNNTFDYIEDEQVAQSLKATKSRRTLTLEQKAELVSRGFFAICIILSIIVWAIPIGKTPAKNHQQFNKSLFLLQHQFQILIKFGMIHRFTSQNQGRDKNRLNSKIRLIN